MLMIYYSVGYVIGQRWFGSRRHSPHAIPAFQGLRLLLGARGVKIGEYRRVQAFMDQLRMSFDLYVTPPYKNTLYHLLYIDLLKIG